MSFRALRRKDATIIRNYRLIIATGAIIASAAIIWELTQGSAVRVLTRGVLVGLALAAYGYHALNAKRVHGDVDAVAVDFSQRYGSSQLNEIYLAHVNFAATDQLNKTGNRILLVGADRLLLCHFADGSWNSSEQPFSKVAALGFFRHNNQTTVYFEFIDGTIFKTVLNPTHIVTTESKTFLRSLLSLLDSWYEAPKATAMTIAARRIILTVGTESQDMVEAVALVGQAQEAQFATTAINSSLAALIQKPRKLEI